MHTGRYLHPRAPADHSPGALTTGVTPATSPRPVGPPPAAPSQTQHPQRHQVHVGCHWLSTGVRLVITRPSAPGGRPIAAYLGRLQRPEGRQQPYGSRTTAR